MRRLTSAILLLLVVWALPLLAQSDEQNQRLRSQLDVIHRDYLRAHAARDVVELVRLDGQLRELIGPSALPWKGGSVFYATRPEDAQIGIVPLVFEPQLVIYSGALLQEAHAINPNLRRSETLYSTVAVGNQMSASAEPGLRYLRDFPVGPFSSAVHYQLGMFYQDLYQAITDIIRGRADGHADCYREFIDRRPLAVQRQAAKEASLSHWRELAQRFPADEGLRVPLAFAFDTEASSWHVWHFCGD